MENRFKVVLPMKGIDNDTVDAAQASRVPQQSALEGEPCASISAESDDAEYDPDSVRPPSRLRRRTSFARGAYQHRRMTEYLEAKRLQERGACNGEPPKRRS